MTQTHPPLVGRRLARLSPLLLGLVLLAVLWGSRRTESGDPLPRERTVVPGGRPPRVPERAARPGSRAGTETRDTGSAPELSMPVAGVDPRTLRDDFSDTRRGAHPHDAIDIVAPRGTPVLAVADGVVRKLFTSVPGGLTVYEFDLEERYCFYYAHLDGYAPSLHEGQRLRRGDLVGYVGTTGNAPKHRPHLHFAVSRLGPDKKWWAGRPINPYPLLVGHP